MASQALGDQPGAVVALDPRTGAVLAMASTPHIDPQQLVLDPRKDFTAEVERAKAYWAAINKEGAGDPLLPRATQGLYVPGSIFKTVTASGALDAGISSLDHVYPDPGDIVIEGHQIVELNRPAPVKNQYTFREGYLYSLNIVFAQIGLDVGTVRAGDPLRLPDHALSAGGAEPRLERPQLPVEQDRAGRHRVRTGRAAGDAAGDGARHRRGREWW